MTDPTISQLKAKLAQAEKEIVELRKQNLEIESEELDKLYTRFAIIKTAYNTMFQAVMKHKMDFGGERCHERDNELYVECGLGPIDRPQGYPIEQHRRDCDVYRAGLYSTPVENEPLHRLEKLTSEATNFIDQYHDELIVKKRKDWPKIYQDMYRIIRLLCLPFSPSLLDQRNKD